MAVAEEDSKKPCRFTLQAASLPLTRRQVVVELSPAYGRRRHPDESVEQDMEALWAQLKASVPQAFNALKFRWVGRARAGLMVVMGLTGIMVGAGWRGGR